MRAAIISDLPRVYAFVNAHTPVELSSGMKNLGLERDGELVAGVLYDGFTGSNIWMHVAAEPSRRWMTREYLRYCFYYPFVELGVRRISGQVAAGNARARAFDEHLGFRHEATLRGAGPDGDDLLIYVMWRDECRFLPRSLAVL